MPSSFFPSQSLVVVELFPSQCLVAVEPFLSQSLVSIEHLPVKGSTTGTTVNQSVNDSKDDTSSEYESSDDEPSKAEAVKKSSTGTKESCSDYSSSEESSDEEEDAPSKTPKKQKTPVTSKAESQGSRSLSMGNLSWSIEQADVENFFKDCGEVKDVRFASYRDGMLKGYGHVEFTTSEAAAKVFFGSSIIGDQMPAPSSPRDGDDVTITVGHPQIARYVGGIFDIAALSVALWELEQETFDNPIFEVAAFGIGTTGLSIEIAQFVISCFDKLELPDGAICIKLDGAAAEFTSWTADSDSSSVVGCGFVIASGDLVLVLGCSMLSSGSPV
nr:nucleolin 2 [Ipomoea trifida]